jgi:hypothetical protein
MATTRSTLLRTLAWWYTGGFLGIFVICHTPGLTDSEGRLLGLFRIDPIDDFVHLLSGSRGALVAWRGVRHIPAYFIVIGLRYNLDAVVGMTWLLQRARRGSSELPKVPKVPRFGIAELDSFSQ